MLNIMIVMMMMMTMMMMMMMMMSLNELATFFCFSDPGGLPGAGGG
jgi:hypothetical protein